MRYYIILLLLLIGRARVIVSLPNTVIVVVTVVLLLTLLRHTTWWAPSCSIADPVDHYNSARARTLRTLSATVIALGRRRHRHRLRDQVDQETRNAIILKKKIIIVIIILQQRFEYEKSTENNNCKEAFRENQNINIIRPNRRNVDEMSTK
jgi:hypothetical protein